MRPPIGGFCVKFHQNKKLKFGFQVQLCFLINLHKKDKALLETIQSFFGVGKLDKNDSEWLGFIVSSIKELEVIINHFDKYPFLTQKQADYLLFKSAFALFFFLSLPLLALVRRRGYYKN